MSEEKQSEDISQTETSNSENVKDGDPKETSEGGKSDKVKSNTSSYN